MVKYLGNMYDPGFQPIGSQENKGKATDFPSCDSTLGFHACAHTHSELGEEMAGYLLTPVVPSPEQA